MAEELDLSGAFAAFDDAAGGENSGAGSGSGDNSGAGAGTGDNSGAGAGDGAGAGSGSGDNSGAGTGTPEGNKGGDEGAGAKVKTFDEEFFERLEGKYKTFDELKEALNAPKVEFADGQIEFLNNLAKEGVKIDANLIAEISADYDSMDNQYDLLFTRLEKENPTWTEEEIAFELKNRYKVNEWADDGEEPTEVEKIMKLKMEREAEEARAFLNERKAKFTYVPKKDPNADAAAKEKAEAALKGWNESTEKAASLISKITTKVSDKDSVEFSFDPKEVGEVSELVKAIGKDASAFWNRYRGDDGKISQAKLIEDILKGQNFEKAQKASYDRGMAAGAESEFRASRNTNFESDKGGSGSGKPLSFEEAAAKSLSEN